MGGFGCQVVNSSHSHSAFDWVTQGVECRCFYSACDESLPDHTSTVPIDVYSKFGPGFSDCAILATHVIIKRLVYMIPVLRLEASLMNSEALRTLNCTRRKELKKGN